MLTINELKDFNVENDREDTVYLIEVHTFRRGYLGWIETTGDPVIFMSDSKEETCQRFVELYGTLSAVDSNKTDRYSRIDIMKAFDIFNGMVEYMAIGSCNTRKEVD